jgi:hypothetical protein
LDYPNRGTSYCFQTIVLYGRKFASGYDINKLRLGCFYATFCEQTKHALRVREDLFTSGHGTSSSASAFGLESSATTDYLTSCQLGTILPGLLEVAALSDNG